MVSELLNLFHILKKPKQQFACKKKTIKNRSRGICNREHYKNKAQITNQHYPKKTCLTVGFLFLNVVKDQNFDKLCERKFLSVQLIFATAII